MIKGISTPILESIQGHFHGLLREKVGTLIEKHDFQLPDLPTLAGSPETNGHFPVPSMYGGFNYWFEGEGDGAALIVLGFSRIVGGSESFYRITAAGWKQIEGDELRRRDKLWVEMGSPVMTAADLDDLVTVARLRETLHAKMAAQFGPISNRQP